MFLYSYIVALPRKPESQLTTIEALEQGVTPQHGVMRRFFTRHLLRPMLDLLRRGATPRQLAWSLAVGVAIGINPIIGSTTVFSLAAAFLFRLNVVATQVANHLFFPAQLALLVVWLGAGDLLFHTTHVGVSRDAFSHALRAHDWATMRMLWTWEWHALIVWFATAAFITPIIATAVTPVLRLLLRGLENQPIVEK